MGLHHLMSRDFEMLLRVSVEECMQTALKNHPFARLVSRQDIVFRAQTAVWNLVKAEKIVEIHEKTLARLDLEKNRAEQLYQNELISSQDYLAVLAQHSQFSHLLDSAEADLEFQLWHWAQALGLKSLPKYRPKLELAIPPDPHVRLEDWLSKAKAGKILDLDEVRRSFSSFKQSLSQLKIAESTLALALTDLSEVELKSGSGDFSVSVIALAVGRAALAEVDLAESQVKYLSSRASFELALKLKKNK